MRRTTSIKPDMTPRERVCEIAEVVFEFYWNDGNPDFEGIKEEVTSVLHNLEYWYGTSYKMSVAQQMQRMNLGTAESLIAFGGQLNGELPSFDFNELHIL